MFPTNLLFFAADFATYLGIFIFSVFLIWTLTYVYRLGKAFHREVIQPLNMVRIIGDVGYNLKEGCIRVHDRHRTQLMKMRKTGDLPPVFPNGWYCVLESSDVGKGEIKQFCFMSQTLMATRTNYGEVHLMDSYCPHLGANFTAGGQVVKEDCVQCPFHGWVFECVSGKCVEVPYDEGRIPNVKVGKWPCVEINKHIYIWFHAEGSEPTWQVPEIEQVESGEWPYRGRTEHEIACHCQEIPENGADMAHLNHLHRAGPDQGSNINRLNLSDKPSLEHNWDGEWTIKSDDEAHIGVMKLKQFLQIKGVRIPWTDSELVAEQVGPGIVLMHFNFAWGKGCVLQHVTPEEPLLQRVRFKMFGNTNLLFSRFFLVSEALQFERDIYIWSNKTYIRNPPLVRNDGPIMKHRRWYNQFYTENSPRLLPSGLSQPVKSSLEW